MPKISVIIPTYNRSELLKEAIKSVLNQSYSDFEIIVVDDGSTDDTRAVVTSYNSSKIIYFFQENRGRSSARNRGIKLARGEYVAFLDSDDIFMPNKLELQAGFLDENESYGMVYSYAKNVDEDGQCLAHHYDGNLSGLVYPDMLFIKNNFITTPTVMVRAKILSEIGGFDIKMHMCEDLDLWRRIARKYKVMQLTEVLAHVRIRSHEKPDIIELLDGRTNYYTNAIRDDENIKNIQKELYREMFSVYMNCAKCHRDYNALTKIIFRNVYTEVRHTFHAFIEILKD
jgi:glycosyltransferase involved in cell wall biosynthesis